MLVEQEVLALEDRAALRRDIGVRVLDRQPHEAALGREQAGAAFRFALLALFLALCGRVVAPVIPSAPRVDRRIAAAVALEAAVGVEHAVVLDEVTGHVQLSVTGEEDHAAVDSVLDHGHGVLVPPEAGQGAAERGELRGDVLHRVAGLLVARGDGDDAVVCDAHGRARVGHAQAGEGIRERERMAVLRAGAAVRRDAEVQDDAGRGQVETALELVQMRFQIRELHKALVDADLAVLRVHDARAVRVARPHGSDGVAGRHFRARRFCCDDTHGLLSSCGLDFWGLPRSGLPTTAPVLATLFRPVAVRLSSGGWPARRTVMRRSGGGCAR